MPNTYLSKTKENPNSMLYYLLSVGSVPLGTSDVLAEPLFQDVPF